MIPYNRPATYLISVAGVKGNTLSLSLSHPSPTPPSITTHHSPSPVKSMLRRQGFLV